MIAGIEIDVGIELVRDEVVVLQRDSFQLQRDIDQRIAAGHLEHLVGKVLEDFRARIVVLVDAMAEAHQPALALLDRP